MAQRALLHKDKVADFANWCGENGVTTRPGKGDWELLQVNFPAGQWNKVYARVNMPEHTTVQDALVPLVRDFIDGRMRATTKHVTRPAAPTPQPEYSAALLGGGDSSPPWE